MITKQDFLDVQTGMDRMALEIIARSGENWFPCGRAWLVVRRGEDVIKLFKKEGLSSPNRSGYSIGKWRLTYDDYLKVYNLRYDYPGTTAFSQQSLNFWEPLMMFAERTLSLMGVPTSLGTWID